MLCTHRNVSFKGNYQGTLGLLYLSPRKFTELVGQLFNMGFNIFLLCVWLILSLLPLYQDTIQVLKINFFKATFILYYEIL